MCKKPSFIDVIFSRIYVKWSRQRKIALRPCKEWRVALLPWQELVYEAFVKSIIIKVCLEVLENISSLVKSHDRFLHHHGKRDITVGSDLSPTKALKQMKPKDGSRNSHPRFYRFCRKDPSTVSTVLKICLVAISAQ